MRISDNSNSNNQDDHEEHHSKCKRNVNGSCVEIYRSWILKKCENKIIQQWWFRTDILLNVIHTRIRCFRWQLWKILLVTEVGGAATIRSIRCCMIIIRIVRIMRLFGRLRVSFRAAKEWNLVSCQTSLGQSHGSVAVAMLSRIALQ